MKEEKTDTEKLIKLFRKRYDELYANHKVKRRELKAYNDALLYLKEKKDVAELIFNAIDTAKCGMP